VTNAGAATAPANPRARTPKEELSVNTRGRIALIAAVLVVAVVAFIVLKPSDNNDNKTSSTAGTTPAGGSSTAKKPAIPNVRVKGGKPVGGIQDLTFAKGDTVRFKVTSDVSDEVHVHGYDFHKDVAPGHPITFTFPGKIDGEFVVELESRAQQIASLKVTP
jgi:hypothetical protein